MGAFLVIIDQLPDALLQELGIRLGNTWRGSMPITTAHLRYQPKQKPGFSAGFLFGCDIITTKNQPLHTRPLAGCSFVPLGEKMLAPNPNLPRFTSPQIAFENLVDDAIQQGPSYKQTYKYALQFGIDPAEVCRYAAASMSNDERDEFQALLPSQPWAIKMITALVKGCREPGLASKIIETARTKKTSHDILLSLAADLDSTITSDPELSLAKLLDSLR